MVRLIDTTLRDGAQAIWSGRIRAEQILPMAMSLDNAGFEAIDFMAGLQFELSVKFMKENPWERMRAVRRVIRDTPLCTHIRSRSLTSFDLMPLEAIRLYIQRAAANGFRRIMIFDALHDIENMKPSIQAAKEAGLHVTTIIFYTVSPFHTDEYYGDVARRYVELGADSVCLRDPSGLLTVERTKTLIPILRKSLGERPLALKSHCSTGLAPDCYVEAVRCGVDALFTATSPLANGPSVPATEEIISRLESELNVSPGVDVRRVEEVASYLRVLAEEEGRPVGERVVQVEADQYEHQVPGGMIAFLRDQLTELNHLDDLPRVLEEIPRVRKDMGYPVMVTPVSQLVGVQAVLNVLHGRYTMIPKEVRRYMLGHYGRPEGPLDPDLLDQVTESAESGDAVQVEEGLLDRIRREHGPFQSDDDLLLHIMFQKNHLEQIPPYNQVKEPAYEGAGSIADLMKLFEKKRSVAYFSLKSDGFRFVGSRHE